jgi:hypothetical protein
MPEFFTTIGGLFPGVPLPPLEPAAPADQQTPSAPTSFTFDALVAIGQHAKAVSEQVEVVRAIEAEMYRFESENGVVVRGHRALLARLSEARMVLADRRSDAFNEIGWQVRK